MDSCFFLTIVAAAICFFMMLRKFRSHHQENKEIDSSSLSPSYSSSHKWTHDVFPSFRGEDVRRDFLSHIHKEFQRKGITPLIDNEIKRGESISPELIRAIRGSKIAIILLSRNYAYSKWCLEELVEIMKCREELGQIMMVIFYKVDPYDVKMLAGEFGKVFKSTCVGKSKEDIKRWRQALGKVATIAGYHSSKCNEWIEKVEEHFPKNFVDVSQGLHVIAEKSLVTISSGYIWMHDLLARFGRKIVCKQSIHERGKGQVLVDDARETCQVLNSEVVVSFHISHSSSFPIQNLIKTNFTYISVVFSWLKSFLLQKKEK